MVKASANQVGEVILENSEFSKSGNGKFILTSDPARIVVTPESVMQGMEGAGLKATPAVETATEAAFEAGATEASLAQAAKVRAVFRIGGRTKRTVTKVAGGWAGAYMASSAFSAFFLPADLAGPEAWAAHGRRFTK